MNIQQQKKNRTQHIPEIVQKNHDLSYKTVRQNKRT